MDSDFDEYDMLNGFFSLIKGRSGVKQLFDT